MTNPLLEVKLPFERVCRLQKKIKISSTISRPKSFLASILFPNSYFQIVLGNSKIIVRYFLQ